jgi:DNA-binding beta-propeller fold protein YncE
MTDPCRFARPVRRLALAAILAVAASSLTGCITLRAPAKDPATWPLPPETPRVRYVRSFRSEADLRTGFGMFLKRLFTPLDPALQTAQPTGLSISPDDKQLIVASAPSGRILAVDLVTGIVRPLAASEGSRPKQPFAAVMDDQRRLYVSDSAMQIVWVFDEAGKAIFQIGKGVLTRPTGLAIDRRRQVLYVVNGGSPRDDAHNVEVFSLAGKHLRRIGKRGTGPGEFFFPSHAAVGKDGTLYVSDVFNSRVQLFSPEGELLGMVGQPGSGAPGLFQKPKGVAVDALGDLHIVDSGSAVVQMFNPKQQPLMGYGGFSSKTDVGLQFPSAIAIDSRNQIFVAEYATNRIVQFELFNTKPEDVFNAEAPKAEPSPKASGAPGTEKPAAAAPARPPSGISPQPPAKSPSVGEVPQPGR